MVEDTDELIRSQACPHCRVCGSSGKFLYQELQDGLFEAPGKWSLKQCVNNECGLIWLDPMPLQQDIHRAYQEYYTHHQSGTKRMSLSRRSGIFLDNSYLFRKYGYKKNPWSKLFSFARYLSPAKRTALEFKVMYLPVLAQGMLLEIGCGSGDMLKFMQELGWQVQGVDFDYKAVQNARSKGLLVSCGALNDQRHPDNHFDAVTMSHVIEHVHDPVELIEEIYRILKPGGRAVIVTPNSDSWGHASFGASWRGLEPPRHLQLFNRTSLTSVVQMVGFQVEKCFTTIRNANAMFVASRALQSVGRHSWGSSAPWSVRKWAKALMFWEWLTLKWSPFAGEELVFILNKPETGSFAKQKGN